MALADEIRAVLSDPMNLPPEFLDHMVQHGAQNPVPVQSLNAPTVIASGVGSTSNAPTRYVGGTTAGAPTSGTYVAGDFVVSHDGHVYICTATGSPGTWSTWPAQGLIDAGFLSAAVNIVSTSSASPTTINTTAGATYPSGVDVFIECYAPSISTPTVAGGFVVCSIWRDSTNIYAFGPITTPAAAQMTIPLSFQVLDSPGAGSHTYTLKAYASSTTGTPAVTASVGSKGVLRVRYA
jgi:hypothetical protein